ncbi:conserved oligomeric Golgi complex subunit 3-like [Watersipora subatra]|uniref:conserved oligomeric Golgi complex subunit 3-like n=1 Tax=Watersipora subatra TaxID=2589382 RepID=UPI00355BC8BA
MADTSASGLTSKQLRESLSKWDSPDNCTAALSHSQKDCILELTSTSLRRPLSASLVDEEEKTSGAVLPDVTSKQKNALLDTLCSTDITNTQQFYSWFCDVQAEMERDEEGEYTDFISQLQDFKSRCDGLLEEVGASLELLNDLQGKHDFVSTKTTSLHQSCEHLLEEQTDLMNVAEAIQNKLSYFNELDRINSKLGTSSLTVTSEGFIPMLTRIDECISYIQSNPRYKDSSVFLLKFHQSLARALSLIKTHVSNLLATATQNVQTSSKGSTSVNDDAFTLYYGKFRTNAPRVKSLIEQIERRVDKNASYQQLLTDCHQCYVNQRETLIEPSVSSAVIDLTVKHKTDHCALMRSGCALMVHICQDEYQLYHHFFSRPCESIDVFLERLCNYLYDAFRPLIIHINHMETLAELCSILKVEMLEDHVQNNPQPLQSFEKVALQMLQDVQERLVYRTYIYIDSDILKYKPASGDLAYPDKLQMMQSIAESMKASERKQQLSSNSMNSSTHSLESQEVEAIVSGAVNGTQTQAPNTHTSTLTVSHSSSMPMSPADLHGMWYPTVRKTLVCLSKLSRCIDSTTFQGLSQEALSFCIQSLQIAKKLITSRKSALDGQLFYIKHLLIIREQISPFHAAFAVKETQLAFGHIKDAAIGLMKRSSDLFKFNSNNSLLQFLVEGTPQATEYLMDSKLEVDQQLKVSCADFIELVSLQLVNKMEDFHTKAEVIRKMAAGEAPLLTSQPFAKPEALRELVAESYRVLKATTPNIHKSMTLYLANRETEAILFKPIKARVQKQYQQLIDVIEKEYGEEESQIIACPTMEQVLLVLASK